MSDWSVFSILGSEVEEEDLRLAISTIETEIEATKKAIAEYQEKLGDLLKIHEDLLYVEEQEPEHWRKYPMFHDSIMERHVAQLIEQKKEDLNLPPYITVNDSHSARKLSDEFGEFEIGGEYYYIQPKNVP